MKNRFLTMLLSAPLCLLFAFAPEQQASEPTIPPKTAYQKIAPAEAKAIMDGNEPYILLDVRTSEEFQEKRLAGALLIPDHEIGKRAEAELPDKNALILVYCRSGRRSASAAKALGDMGYTNVFDFGGIMDWPYETIGG